MMDYIEVHWTCGSIDEARKISRLLVQEKLVACAQIIPWVESVFIWNQQMDTAQETKAIFKTRRDHYEKIKELIQKNCTYEVPEITYIAIQGGNQEYFSWIEETLDERQRH